MNTEQTRTFREYEKQLDEHYMTLDLWEMPRPEAIYGVLTALDAVMLIPMFIEVPPLLSGYAQRLKGCEDSISQALRWLCSGDDGLRVESTSDDKVIEAAHHFTQFAAHYVDIADFHMMYGREWATVDVDQSVKTVTFDSVDAPGRSDALTFHEQIREQSNRGIQLARKIAPEQVEKAMKAIQSVGYRLVDGRIVLDALPDDFIEQVDATSSMSLQFELLPLPPTADLVGFSMGEYWSFCKALLAWSHTATMRYGLCVKQGVPQQECMPVQIVEEKVFVNQAARLASLGEATVIAILDRLTFRPSLKADIRLTPFIRCSGNVCWSPAVFMKTRHERNMLKVMARGLKVLKDRADTLIGSRDRKLCGLAGQTFSKYGYQFKFDTDISAGCESTDVDVLLYQSKRPEQVLLVEAKALLAPDEINEVSDAHKTLLGAQKQLERAFRILRGMPLSSKQEKFKFVDWNRVTNLYGVVMSSDAEPHPLFDPRDFPAISYNTLRWRFRNRDFRSPERFWRACVERPWLENEVKEGKRQYIELKVGDLTYRLPAREMESVGQANWPAECS